jgi:hypothetical protein
MDRRANCSWLRPRLARIRRSLARGSRPSPGTVGTGAVSWP